MADDNEDQQATNEHTEKINPLAQGYWSHLCYAVGLMLFNIAMLVGMIGYAYSIYQTSKTVAQHTPDKRLQAMQLRADGGKRALFVSANSVGVDSKISGLAASLEKHHAFYEDMLESEQAFSRYLHLQQNTIDHFVEQIGRSQVWQQQYLQKVLALPTRSATRQNLIQRTLDSFQKVTTLDDISE